jgi:hypothetical protein
LDFGGLFGETDSPYPAAKRPIPNSPPHGSQHIRSH